MLMPINRIAGGRIHVIDGLLDWPAGSQAKLLDIMDTLKQCDKFDGFVTLAEGTGLTQILKQGKSKVSIFSNSSNTLTATITQPAISSSIKSVGLERSVSRA